MVILVLIIFFEANEMAALTGASNPFSSVVLLPPGPPSGRLAERQGLHTVLQLLMV